MATTPNGFPYPVGTDADDVPYWNLQLANKAEARLGVGNTAGVDITASCTPQPGWTINLVQVVRRNGWGALYVNFTRSGAALASAASGNVTNANVVSIPSAYWPVIPASGAINASGFMLALFYWTDGMLGIGAFPPGIGIGTGEGFSATFIFPLTTVG